MEREEEYDSADSDSHPPYEMSDLSAQKQIQVLNEPVRRDGQFIRPTSMPSPRSPMSSPATSRRNTPQRANANRKQTSKSPSTVELRSKEKSKVPPSFQLITSSSSQGSNDEPENTKRQKENSSYENVEPG